MGDQVGKSVEDVTLVLHIGLHKTASSYVQNVLSSCRYDLLNEGVLFPATGTNDAVVLRTREGAQSGHILFTRPGDPHDLVQELLTELPDSASTVLLSAEDYSLPRRRPTPEQYLAAFSAFGTIKVVLVLRRQDTWIESFYKQAVDQFNKSETRSFDEYLRQVGPSVLDFYARFSPWRDLVGPENFHVLSYDDLPDGTAMCRRFLDVVGVRGPLLDEVASVSVPRYESVRAIDTLGLRILNSYRLQDRDTRVRAAKAIYSAAPEGDIELMTPAMREGIQARCDPINGRIEAEWFGEPVPGFRFGSPPPTAATPPSGTDLVDYLDQVIALCEDARSTADADKSA